MRKRPIVNGTKENGTNKIKIRVDEDELELINNLRTLWNQAIDEGIDPSEVKHGWLKSDKSSLFVKNHAYKEPEQKKLEENFENLIEQFKDYSPNYPTIKRVKSKDGHLLVVDPADIHIGKLCKAFETSEEYNSQIAVQRVKEGVQGLLNKSQGFNIDKILLVIGNDVLHTDTPKRTTTLGTPQDTEGMWYDNFLDGVRLYVDIIESLMQVADVHVTFNPSNHDYMSGFFLAQLIETHFRNSENITFNVSISHRKYFTYGENLIGSTHGDGAKTADLPLLMAHEAIDWAKCKHRYIYTHHIHHKTAKDIMSVCVESLRSPSGADSWHHKKGYQHAPQAVEGFLHHKKHGQIARFTHLF
jgi:uncharacterized protein YktA (UPF0223 family)